MTAITAYAAYLHSTTGKQPETSASDGSATVTCRYTPGRRLTVSFRYAADKSEWRPSGIHVAYDGSGASFKPGHLSEALGMLLSEPGGVAPMPSEMPSEALQAVAEYVLANPGCSKADVHHAIGSGWTTIDKAISKGLIDATRQSPRRPYRLYPPPPQSGGER